MVLWKACRKSHSNCGVWRKLWDSQSNPMGGFDTEVFDSPSIGARISTCLWMAGQRIGSHTGSSHCGMMDLDGSVGVPTMQGGVWLVHGWVHHVLDHHCLVVLLVDVERLNAR